MGIFSLVFFQSDMRGESGSGRAGTAGADGAIIMQHEALMKATDEETISQSAARAHATDTPTQR